MKVTILHNSLVVFTKEYDDVNQMWLAVVRMMNVRQFQYQVAVNGNIINSVKEVPTWK